MYRVLYRKWRPKSFFDVVGQEHHNRHPQKRNNDLENFSCLPFHRLERNRQDHLRQNFRKGGQLPSSEGRRAPATNVKYAGGIDDGTVLDVEEIDAASNNGVDNIREIRDEVNFAPPRQNTACI